jgi:tRNA(His) guanylyltransferase
LENFVPKFKTLDERCKFFEKNFGNMPYLMPQAPMLCRIDGRAFHTFCRGLKKPFDERLSLLMVDTLKHLMKETGALWGYTQSDEISLCWHSSNEDTQLFFDGRRQKIESMTASLTTQFFNAQIAPRGLPEKAAHFDSRAWSVPTKAEAAAYAVWRERDCTKNSVSMAARTVFSHKEIHKVNREQMIEWMCAKGIEWCDYPDFFKYGTFLRSTWTKTPLTPKEYEELPPKHLARSNPTLLVERKQISTVLNPLMNIEVATAMLFYGE